jgi:hypothetical protein
LAKGLYHTCISPRINVHLGLSDANAGNHFSLNRLLHSRRRPIPQKLFGIALLVLLMEVGQMPFQGFPFSNGNMFFAQCGAPCTIFSH